jgi:hypothetical protein
MPQRNADALFDGTKAGEKRGSGQ